jgi:hypothetical protein
MPCARSRTRSTREGEFPAEPSVPSVRRNPWPRRILIYLNAGAINNPMLTPSSNYRSGTVGDRRAVTIAIPPPTTPKIIPATGPTIR